mgnify:CR=1 FL=1
MKVDCPDCKGKGWDGYTILIFINCRKGPPNQEYASKKDCKLCKGTGKIDWLTRVTRKGI